MRKEITLEEATARGKGTKKYIGVVVPKELHEKWQKAKKRKSGFNLSKILTHVMWFYLYGNHNFNNPYVAISTILDEHSKSNVAVKSFAISIIKAIAESSGLKVTISEK